MIIDETWLQSNKRVNKLVQDALAKEAKGERLLEKGEILKIQSFEQVKKGRITVADKVDRTYKDGIVFASKGEMNRWDYLLNIQRAGEIKDLERQIPFELQPGFYSPIHGKIEPILYVADFVYTNLTFRPGFENFRVIEDHKGGYTTEVFKLKRKLMLHRYPQYLFYEVS